MKESVIREKLSDVRRHLKNARARANRCDIRTMAYDTHSKRVAELSYMKFLLEKTLEGK